MMTTIRNTGVIANGTEIGEAFLVKGQASTVATFVRVRWYWIALPVAVWTLGFVAWVVAVIRTKRLQLPTRSLSSLNGKNQAKLVEVMNFS